MGNVYTPREKLSTFLTDHFDPTQDLSFAAVRFWFITRVCAMFRHLCVHACSRLVSLDGRQRSTILQPQQLDALERSSPHSCIPRNSSCTRNIYREPISLSFSSSEAPLFMIHVICHIFVPGSSMDPSFSLSLNSGQFERFTQITSLEIYSLFTLQANLTGF